MSRVPTYRVEELSTLRPEEPAQVMCRQVVSRDEALDAFTQLVRDDAGAERWFAPDGGHRLVLVQDGPFWRSTPAVENLAEHLVVAW